MVAVRFHVIDLQGCRFWSRHNTLLDILARLRQEGCAATVQDALMLQAIDLSYNCVDRPMTKVEACGRLLTLCEDDDGCD